MFVNFKIWYEKWDAEYWKVIFHVYYNLIELKPKSLSQLLMFGFFFSTTVEGAAVCFATVVRNKEWLYVDRVIRLYVYVNLVRS
jgi:hypothetical protein